MPINTVIDFAGPRSDNKPNYSTNFGVGVGVSNILNFRDFIKVNSPNIMRFDEQLEDNESTYPVVLSDEANRSVYYALQEMQSVRDRAEKLVNLAPSDLQFDEDFKFGLERVQLEISALTESLVVKKQARIAVGQQYQTSTQILRQSIEPAKKTYHGEPEWMLEVRDLRASGVIPDYQGKRKDGDAYHFYKKHYAPWLNVMNQKLLRQLTSNAFISRLEYSARLMGCSLSDLVPPITENKQ